MDSFLLILNSFKTVFSILFSLWWVYLPAFLFFLAYFSIKNYNNLKYRLGLEWVLLEIKIPKEVRKSPKAMEQIFAGLHGVYTSSLDFKDKFFKGKILDWFSFEMVGKGGETHFYIRTLKKYKNIVEAQVYAYYPEAEIYEVTDYVNSLPAYLPDEKYDLWGTDLILNKEDAYPIRTYPDFEEKAVGPDDVKRVDPLASMSELFSTLRPGEQIWVQIVGTPVGSGWIEKGQLVLDKIMGKEVPVKTDFVSDMFFAIDKALTSSSTAPIEEKKEKKERVDLSPGKQEAIKAMERSWDKLGYEVVIRILYIGLKGNFNQAHSLGVLGVFKQFSSQNLNGFKVNKFTLTYAKGLFKKSKLFKKKRIIYQFFKERRPALLKYVLNTEELATIYHFPDTGVKSPLLPRVEAKKGEPPSGLPII